VKGGTDACVPGNPCTFGRVASVVGVVGVAGDVRGRGQGRMVVVARQVFRGEIEDSQFGAVDNWGRMR